MIISLVLFFSKFRQILVKWRPSGIVAINGTLPSPVPLSYGKYSARRMANVVDDNGDDYVEEGLV